jgi:hypothetical protein
MRAHRLTPVAFAIAVAVAVAALPARAVDNTMTSAGYTGLGITPNAHLLGWGRAEAAYESQVAGNVRRLGGHNAVLGFGLLPNLEIAGRLATNTIHDSCFSASMRRTAGAWPQARPTSGAPSPISGRTTAS